MSTDDPFCQAISADNLSALRSLLETQDHHLLAQTAQHGSPETAAFLLSRHPDSAPRDYSQHLSKPDPAIHPLQYLSRESARNGNTAVFRYLITEYPTLLTTHNRNVEHILVSAITGGIPIWKIILEADPRWKDHEFSGHRGCVLERVLELGGDANKDLLEFLLKMGADTDRVGDPVLESFRARGAGKDILELVRRYC